MRTYAVFVRREGVAYIQAENEDEAYASGGYGIQRHLMGRLLYA